MPLPEETLTTTAPADDPTGPSVEEDPLGLESEVGDGSAQQQTVPKARFDGLMGRLNREIEDRKRIEAELEALRNTKETSPVADDSNAEIRELLEDLRTERLENARLKALTDFPEIAPVADLITATNPKDYLEVARELAGRLKGATSKPGSETPPPVAGEKPPVEQKPAQEEEPPVSGGGTTFNGQNSASERVAAALAKRDFGAYLQAKFDLAAESGEIEGLELTA